MIEDTKTLREWFNKTLWSLMPRGHSKQHTYEIFLDTIKKSKNLETGQLITKEFILEKFSKYIAYKDSLKNATFQEKKKETIFTWLSDKMWDEDNEVQVAHNPTRDKYLFNTDY